jgi:hypothetical protein
MTTKQELAILREMVRIHRSCPEQVAKYTRLRWVSTAAAWILIFFAFLLSRFEHASGVPCLVLALLGGASLGAAIMFSASAKQIPLLVRFTTLHEQELQKRLEELNNG